MRDAWGSAPLGRYPRRAGTTKTPRHQDTRTRRIGAVMAARFSWSRPKEHGMTLTSGGHGRRNGSTRRGVDSDRSPDPAGDRSGQNDGATRTDHPALEIRDLSV